MGNITVVGAGYVGLVTATCFAELGHQVKIVEIDREKVLMLQRDVLPISEAGLDEMWLRNRANGRLSVTEDYASGLIDSEFAFVAVGTPSTTNGKPNLKWVYSATRCIAESCDHPLVVVIRSTVPVGTSEMVARILARHARNGNTHQVVSSPEFLREGLAVYDFMNPSRIVIGASDANAGQVVAQLWGAVGCQVVCCDNRTSEMIKYAANSFLATKISFINEVATLCDRFGINVKDVARAVGMDKRIGPSFLDAGLGWGGSCLPKDTRALIHMAKSVDAPAPLLRAVVNVNREQPRRAVVKLQKMIGPLDGKTIGVLGLAFKPDCDDMREASSIALVGCLRNQGCQIRAYDPLAMKAAARIMPDVCYCRDAYQVAENSDALVLVTEWSEFRDLDLARLRSLMRQPVVLDGRNFLDPQEFSQAGFSYDGMGRGAASVKQDGFSLVSDKQH